MEANERDRMLLIPLILLAIEIILGVLLRSITALLYLTFTIIRGYTATLGLSPHVFHYMFDYDGVSSALAPYLFVVSAALVIGHSVSLMTPIHDKTAKRELGEGGQVLRSRTGGVFTAAGIILARTLTALMTLPLRGMFQIGPAVVIGVLLDTFITRTIMMPPIM